MIAAIEANIAAIRNLPRMSALQGMAHNVAMLLHKREKIGKICPYCGAEYSIASMAERCLKTGLCRQFNAPTEHHKAQFNAMMGITVWVAVLARALRREGASDALKAQGERLYDECVALVEHARERFTVAPRFERKLEDAIFAAASHVWTPKTKVDLRPVCETVLLLLDDFANCPLFANEMRLYSRADLKKNIKAMRKTVGKINALAQRGAKDEPEENFGDAVEGVYSRLYPIIFGLEQPIRLPKVYAVAERWVVSGWCKADARAFVQREFGFKGELGKVGIAVRGLPKFMPLADGSGKTVRDLVRFSAGRVVPDLLGLCGEL